MIDAVRFANAAGNFRDAQWRSTLRAAPQGNREASERQQDHGESRQGPCFARATLERASTSHRDHFSKQVGSSSLRSWPVCNARWLAESSF